MIFLQPALLFLTALAAIPVIIHLLGERHYRKVPFPDLRLFREIRDHALRRIKLRQWLILLLRVLWMLFLVLALAGPFFSGHSLLGTKPEPGFVLVDRSFSMGRYPEAKEGEKRIREAFPDWKIFEYSEADSPDSLNADLNRTSEQTKNARPDIIWFTDLQDNPWNRRLLMLLTGTFPSSQLFFLHPPAGDPGSSIRKIGLEKGYDTDGETVYTLNVTADSDGPSAPTAYLNLGGNRTAQFTLTEQGQGSYSFRSPGNSDWLPGSVMLEGDAFPDDDIRYFVLPPLQSPSVLYLNSTGAQDYFGTALRSISGYSVTTSTASELSSLALDFYDMIIIDGDDPSLKLQEQRLRAFKGPLLYVPSLSADRSALFTDIAGTLIPSGRADGSSFLTVEQTLPPFDISEHSPADIEVSAYSRIESSSGTPLWILSNGHPLFIRTDIGRIFLFLSPFEFSANRMGLNPWFISDLRTILSGMLDHRIRTLNTGDIIPAATGGTMTVIRPDGIRETSEGQYRHTDLPGIYTVTEGKTQRVLAVNISPDEAVYRTIEPDSSFIIAPAASESLAQVTDTLRGKAASFFFIVLAAVFFGLETALLTFNRKGLF